MPPQSPLEWEPRLVSKTRLQERVLELGEYGATPSGGVTRLAFSDADRAAVNQVSEWLKPTGYRPHLDSAGNTTWRAPGASGESVLVGSHLDSVPEGGRFDGAAGVIAAVEVVQVLHDLKINPPTPIEIVAFAGEEGSRFDGGLMGSMAATGKLDDSLLASRDANGVSLETAMRSFGVKRPSLASAKWERGTHTAYFELHVEQASALEAAQLPVGIVTGIAAINQLTIRIEGTAGHAGATPMEHRRDPLVAAAHMVQFVERLALSSGGRVRATVGELRVTPGASNVIPGSATFTVDLRSLEADELKEAARAVTRELAAVCRERGLTHGAARTLTTTPVMLEDRLVSSLAELAEREGIPHMRMPSGAAHDAMLMQEHCGAAMVFVRSEGGHSHCKEEHTEALDLAAGTELLLLAVADAAGVSRGALRN